MCVCVRARSIKSAIEFVCAHVKDIEWLAYWNMRGDMCSLSLWHGYLPAALDYRSVVGEEGVPTNYRGTMVGICVERDAGACMHKRKLALATKIRGLCGCKRRIEIIYTSL